MNNNIKVSFPVKSREITKQVLARPLNVTEKAFIAQQLYDKYLLTHPEIIRIPEADGLLKDSILRLVLMMVARDIDEMCRRG
jgi:hypothetical protein